MKKAVIKITLVIFCSSQAFSQTESVKPNHQWDLGFTAGIVVGGAGPAMNKILKEARYQTRGDFSTHNHFPWVVDVSRAINSRLSLGINIGWAYQSTYYTYKTYTSLFCKFKMTTLNPVIKYNFKDIIFLESGPALRYILYTNLEDGPYGPFPHTSIGLTLKSELVYPKNTRVYAKIGMEYCFASQIKVDFKSSSDYRLGILQVNNLNTGSFYAGAGFGIRLKRSHK